MSGAFSVMAGRDEPQPLIGVHPERIIAWGIERPVVIGEPPHIRDVR